MTGKGAGKPKKWLRILLPTAIIALWLAAAGVGGPYFGRISEVSEIDLVAFLPKSSESVEVTEKVREFNDDKVITAIVVFESKRERLT